MSIDLPSILFESIGNQILTMQYFSISNKSQLPVKDGIEDIIIRLRKIKDILHYANSFHNFVIVIDITPDHTHCQYL